MVCRRYRGAAYMLRLQAGPGGGEKVGAAAAGSRWSGHGGGGTVVPTSLRTLTGPSAAAHWQELGARP